MNSKDIRALQESYMNVYQVDEIFGMGKKKETPSSPLASALMNTPYFKKRAAEADAQAIANLKGMFSKDPEERKRTAQRMSRSPDAENRTDLRKVEQVDLYDIILSHLLYEGYAETPEAAERILMNMGEEWIGSIMEKTAMSKRGYDEAPIRQKIAKFTGGGKSADRATKLENQPTYGDAKKAKQRQNYARAQRGDFRNTTSSNPGLHGYAHQSNNPEVKAKQAARGAQRGALTPNERKTLNMGYEFDLLDIIKGYLLGEGYAETPEAAERILMNMGEEWKQSIIEAVYGGTPKPTDTPADTRLTVTAADKKANTPAYQEFTKGNPKYKPADHLKGV